MNIKVILAAGGNSSRLKQNKLLIKFNDIPVLVRVVKTFLSIGDINQIVICSPKSLLTKYSEILYEYNINEKVVLIEGGSSRRESVYNGISYLSSDTDMVLIHDGARMLVTKELIIKCIEETKIKKCTCVGVKSKDTIKIVNDNKVITNTPKRENVYNIQTPQSFIYSIAKEIHEYGHKNNMEVTDDSSLAELLGYDVHIIDGDYKNIKITTKEDVDFVNSLLLNS